MSQIKCRIRYQKARNSERSIEQGADILIVGRYVTQSKEVERSVRDFLELAPSRHEDFDLYRVHTE